MITLYIQTGTRKTSYRSSVAVVEVDFTANPHGERCGRCNLDLNVHVSQLLDPAMREQDGVIDCETVAVPA